MTQENATTEQNQPSAFTKGLDPNAILIAEFDYARETAAQAMEDRHKMVQFYVISIFIPFLTAAVGLIAIGKKTTELVQSSLFQYALLVVFTLLLLMGILFLLKLIRLRVAWFQSAQCMNKIKNYYSSHLKELNLEKDAFMWTFDSLKNLKFGKTNSIFFYSALLIMMIDSIAFSATLLFGKVNSTIVLAGSVFFFLIQIIYYKVQKF